MSQAPVLDRDSCNKRLKKLYTAWKHQSADATQNSRPLDDYDAIVVGLAKGLSDETTYAKSLSIFIWLFGYELPESLLVLTEERVYFLSSKKKIEFLQPLENQKLDGVPPVKLLTREKNADGAEFFDEIFASIKKRGGKAEYKIGAFVKDPFKGTTFDQFKARMPTENAVFR